MWKFLAQSWTCPSHRQRQPRWQTVTDGRLERGRCVVRRTMTFVTDVITSSDARAYPSAYSDARMASVVRTREYCALRRGNCLVSREIDIHFETRSHQHAWEDVSFTSINHHYVPLVKVLSPLVGSTLKTQILTLPCRTLLPVFD